MLDGSHVPVLVEQAVGCLAPQRGGTYIDATFGAGGHSREILARLPDSGRLLAADCDASVARFAQPISDRRFCFVHGNFCRIDQIAAGAGIDQAAGIIMDLGMSSMQLADAGRGFSFARAAPLDMRLDPDNDRPLADWLRSASEKEIGRVIRRFGQERNWRSIAAAIVERRRQRRLADTADLSEAVASALGRGRGRIHPATRTFQALRIQVNRELTRLSEGLAAAERLLGKGGRIAVISFHSLEDRIVRDFFAAGNQGGASWTRIIRLGRPTPEEEEENPRSRSARLRAFERL